MTLVPAFETRVDARIVEGLVQLGYFEDPHTLSLALGTTSENVIILSPHAQRDDSKRQGIPSNKLAINRQITCLGSATYSAGATTILLVGTATNLLAYDVVNNADVFYKDIPDGVRCVEFGFLDAVDNNAR